MREWINRAILVDPENMPMRYNFACALATHLNDFDRAIELLVPVLGTATVSLLGHAKVDPDLDPLRADPPLRRLLAAAETRLAGGSPADRRRWVRTKSEYNLCPAPARAVSNR